MKKLVSTIFSILATSMVLSVFAQTNLDVDGKGIFRASTPRIDLYDTDNARGETYMFSSAGNFFLHSRFGDISFRADDNAGFSTRMFIDGTDGQVGIGTTSPSSRLHLVDGEDVSLNQHGYLLMGNTTSANLAMDINEIQARNNSAASALYLNHEGGDLLLNGKELGQVGIGVLSPGSMPNDQSYLLAVDGKIIAEELRVELSGSWPDYVFEDDYDLLSIDEFAKSIDENGHLPGVPSAQIVETEGQLIGDIQRKMMEKIEELSLYIIQLNNKNKALEAEIKAAIQKINQ